MKKYLKKMLMLSLVVSLLCPITAMATPKGRYELSRGVEEESILLPETIKTSIGKENVVERSKALASAMCSITDTEKGIINIYAETLMFQPVDWAALTIYLEKLNETRACETFSVK